MHDRRVPLARRLRAVHGQHPYQVPFRAGAFDAVLACGVLEHVADVGRSLDELHRVLVPGGRLFVYNLPNRYSYKEALIGRLRLGYSHDRRYTKASIEQPLRAHGFEILDFGRAGLLPHLATGLPSPARRLYDRMSLALFPVDRVLLPHASGEPARPVARAPRREALSLWGVSLGGPRPRPPAP
jgi:SAM-dependent methyltransferase